MLFYGLVVMFNQSSIFTLTGWLYVFRLYNDSVFKVHCIETTEDFFNLEVQLKILTGFLQSMLGRGEGTAPQSLTNSLV